MQRALIFGITGQDGSYLAELLISKGYEVHGVIRRSSTLNTSRIDHIYTDPHESGPLKLHYGDLADASGIQRILDECQPDEVYNLAAQSHVRVSFDQPVYTADVVATGALRLLEAFRVYAKHNKAKLYQASSSEMFGSAPPPQNENTPFRPQSPYAVAKVAAYWNAVNYRDAYGLFICNGILFNHESPRRGETFVTRKITRALTRIKLGLQDRLYLGNLDARRDWGHAKDYVYAMWLMMQNHAAADYVVATGNCYTVREFLQEASKVVGIDWRDHVSIDERYRRPNEVDALQGDASKASRVLGWTPSIRFNQLVREMVDSDMRLAKQEALLSCANFDQVAVA